MGNVLLTARASQLVGGDLESLRALVADRFPPTRYAAVWCNGVVVSMREVAATAAVSVGTVSNVLNSPEKVAPATVARVHAAIDELGFVRNDAARQLKAGRSRSVGLVVLDVGNPFFTDVARAAEHRAADHDLTLLLGTSDEDAGRERAYIDAFDEQRVFGLLVSPIGDDLSRLSVLRGRGTPVVLVDRDGRGTPFDSVAVDDAAGGRLAVGHFWPPAAAGSPSPAGPPGCGRSTTASAGPGTPSPRCRARSSR